MNKRPIQTKITVTVPNRLHMFTTRSLFNVNNMTGGAGISIESNQKMSISVDENTSNNETPSLVLDFFCEILKEKIGFQGGIHVSYTNVLHKHCGFGTTVSQICALCIAINYLYGGSISNTDIRRLIMEHYREEVGNELVRGLETGVGPACSLYGGINYVTNSESLVHLEVPEQISVITFIPQETSFNRNISYEEEFGHRFKSYQADEESLEVRTDLLYRKYIPALLKMDWSELGSITEKLHTMGLKRFECERFNYVYEIKMIDYLLESGALIAGLSSLGPLNYFLIEDDKINDVEKILRDEGYALQWKQFQISKTGVRILNKED